MGSTTTSRRSATRRPPKPLPTVESAKSMRSPSKTGATPAPVASPADAAALLDDKAIALAIDRLLEKKVATFARLMDGRARALEEKVSQMSERISRLEARLAAAGIESRARPLGSEAVDESLARAVVQAPAFKALLDARFKTMLLHLDGDVIPRAVLRTLISNGERATARRDEEE